MVGIVVLLYGVFGTLFMMGVSMALNYRTTTMQDIAIAILWPIALVVGTIWLLYKSIVELIKFIKSWNWSTKS